MPEKPVYLDPPLVDFLQALCVVFTDPTSVVVAQHPDVPTPDYRFEFRWPALGHQVDRILGLALNSYVITITTPQRTTTFRFREDPDYHPVPLSKDWIGERLQAARHQTEAIARIAGDWPSWRGRVAHNFACAAAHLLHTAEVLLDESHQASYPLEKLDKALQRLEDGVIDANDNGFDLDPAFIRWMLKRVRAR